MYYSFLLRSTKSIDFVRNQFNIMIHFSSTSHSTSIPEKKFTGEIKNGKYLFSRRIFYFNAFLPAISASLQEEESTTNVEIIMKMKPLSLAFFLFMVSIPIIQFYINFDVELNAMAILLVGIFLMEIISFYPEAYAAKKIIRDNLNETR